MLQNHGCDAAQLRACPASRLTFDLALFFCSETLSTTLPAITLFPCSKLVNLKHLAHPPCESSGRRMKRCLE